MKSFLFFILILANNISFACGYYPCDEDTRFSLFNPTVFGYRTYSKFYYSSEIVSSYGDFTPKEFALPNHKLWFTYCHGKVGMTSIALAVSELTAAKINKHSQNEMIQYLYQQKDSDALNYLRFAKNCELYNSLHKDLWGRNYIFTTPKRTQLMNQAIALAKKVPNKMLRKRYTFLAIRLAWYNNDLDKIQPIFASMFEKTKKKDILYYWSLYFKSITEKDHARANFELAQVFANAVDKRYVCYQHYDTDVSIKKALRFASTKKEKANVYLFYGIDKPDMALPYLQKMYALHPNSEGLSFLLLREINKIEDYVFTPYYTLFEPTPYDFFGTGDTSTRQTLQRSERDRLYAKKVLRFLNSVDFRKVENPIFWQCSKAYLQIITRDYNACLALVNPLEKATSDKTILRQLQIIKALALVTKQAKGKAVLPVEIQSTILAHQKNKQFIFAIGKELEYLGNTNDAALLYATLDSYSVNWKTLKNRAYTYRTFFGDYFEYVDAVYTPEQTQLLLDDIQKNKNNKDRFAVFKYKTVKKEISLLYDLLGTKYIRQNKLRNALAAFGKTDRCYWLRHYTNWEERHNVFQQNPFYRLKYTPKFIKTIVKIRLNKYTITKQLLSYLRKAENKHEKNRDYYYFLVANAYYNMGEKGNAWMMRRISGWSYSIFSVIEDETEFRQSDLAKQYYLLAKQHSKTAKFKALCLRMVVRCERNKMEYKYNRDNNYLSTNNAYLATNKYYKELHKKYPDYFNDLVSSCDNFEAYFKARR